MTRDEALRRAAETHEHGSSVHWWTGECAACNQQADALLSAYEEGEQRGREAERDEFCTDLLAEADRVAGSDVFGENQARWILRGLGLAADKVRARAICERG